MRNRLLLLLAASTLFVGCMPCAHCRAQSLDPLKKIGEHDANYNVGKNVEALPLPTGDQKIWLTLVVADDYENSPRDLQVNRWFYNHPRLVKIREAVNFNCYRVSNPLYAQPQQAGGMGAAYGTLTPALGATRAAKFIGEANLPPILRIREGGSMPKDPDVLADMIYDSLSQAFAAPRFPGQADVTPLVATEDCPDGKPCPIKPVLPNPQPVVQPDEILPPSSNQNLIIGAVIGGVALVGFLFLAVTIVTVMLLRKPQTKPAASGPSGLL